MTESKSLEDAPFHPHRDGCDCLKRGLMDEEECVHDDPCWTSKAAYEASLPREKYVISDERLDEIRSLIEVDATGDRIWLHEGTTEAACAAAIYDLLSERDDRG